MPDILEQSTGRLTDRFFLTALVPTAVFAPTLFGVILSSTGHLASVISWFAKQTTASQGLLLLAIAAAVWLLATLLASQLSNVVKFYEGYLLADLCERVHASTPGVRAHRRRCSRARARDVSERGATGSLAGSAMQMEAAEYLYDNYPPQLNRILPTTFGNIMRAAEDYASHRYGFEIIHLWTRLTVVLPKDYLDDVERSIIQYQAPLVFSLGFGLLAVISLVLVFATRTSVLPLFVFAAASGLSWVSYRLSFQPARHWGDLLRTAVDLFRKDLLQRWWPELLAVEDDRERLEILREFVITGNKPSIVPRAARKEGSENVVARVARLASKATSKMPSRHTEGPASGPVQPGGTGDDTTPVPTADEGKHLVRLSACFLAVVVVLSAAGAVGLLRNEWVLVANQGIAPFSDVTNSVKVKRVERFAVPPDAFKSSPNRGDVTVKAVAGTLSLRHIKKEDVIRRSDVGPRLSPESAVVVEIVRPRVQVKALDLRPGDFVVLETPGDGAVSSKCGETPSTATLTVTEARQQAITTATVTEGSFSGTAPRSFKGEVLAVADTSNPENSGVLVRVVADNVHGSCLGDLSGAEMLRDS